ncbi:uncharacterized protein LOC121259208 [Juglans microcarpa x Juglans regia]|uniref:uncharacterized protein LOC121259208 n=1 Tax=Juglans microcarpa x Juglans regia TaxID=2249226 RepID=UPI001B7E4D20|nr:uncharacterized protein LOC121259208 [Juglans microcarpa x Juglans regia]
MKASGSRVLFLVVGTVFLFINFSCSITGSFIPDKAFAHHGGDGMIMTATSRRLKENGYNSHSNRKRHAGNVNLDDYHPIDPVPSSKASIKPGPIQHETPLNPYIPRPSPPDHPKNGGST